MASPTWTTSASGGATAPEALFMNIAWWHRFSAPTGRRRTSVLDSDLPAWGDEPSASTNRPGGSSMIEHVFDPRNLRYASRHRKIISGGNLGAECSQPSLVSPSSPWLEPSFGVLGPG